MIISAGSAACDNTIQRLVKRISRRIFTNGDLTPTPEQFVMSFPATPQSLPEYYDLQRFADREEYHARLQAFIRMGAVCVDWDRGSGERGQLARITMTDPLVAAELLKIKLPWAVAAAAIQALSAVAKVGLPSVECITDGWRHGKSPGGIAAENAGQFIDSMRVIEAVQRLGEGNKDLLVRRISAQLFGDTKRIEALARPIAFLMGEPENDEQDTVFARLGLVKHPQPLLLSGPPACRVRVGTDLIPLVRPYIGLRPDTVEGLEIGSETIRHCLTVENLASFNEAAQHVSNPSDLLLIYVAGNPTPALLAAYKRILSSIKPANVMHWGDIDVGGFRIAARLADSAIAVGQKLSLWCMNSAEIATDQSAIGTEYKVDQIATICEKYGWLKELEGLKQRPVFQEQEFIKWEPAFAQSQ